MSLPRFDSDSRLAARAAEILLIYRDSKRRAQRGGSGFESTDRDCRRQSQSASGFDQHHNVQVMMEKIQLMRIFLSCVSREFGIDRPNIKEKLGESGITLTVQEDFECTASPVGTLGKIYRFIKDSDLVVQVIGPTPPRKVRIEIAQEVLALDPNFARWLAQRAIMPALKEAERVKQFETAVLRNLCRDGSR